MQTTIKQWWTVLRFEDLTAMKVKMSIFWVVTRSQNLEKHRRDVCSILLPRKDNSNWPYTHLYCTVWDGRVPHFLCETSHLTRIKICYVKTDLNLQTTFRQHSPQWCFATRSTAPLRSKEPWITSEQNSVKRATLTAFTLRLRNAKSERKLNVSVSEKDPVYSELNICMKKWLYVVCFLGLCCEDYVLSWCFVLLPIQILMQNHVLQNLWSDTNSDRGSGFLCVPLNFTRMAFGSTSDVTWNHAVVARLKVLCRCLSEAPKSTRQDRQWVADVWTGYLMKANHTRYRYIHPQMSLKM